MDLNSLGGSCPTHIFTTSPVIRMSCLAKRKVFQGHIYHVTRGTLTAGGLRAVAVESIVTLKTGSPPPTQG